MLTRLIVIGVVLLVGALVYVLVRSAMSRGSRSARGSATQASAPVDIVDRPATKSSGTPKFESSDDRIARLEEELRRLNDEGDGKPSGSA